MQISTSALLASQTPAARSNDPAADFAPLHFKKTAAPVAPAAPRPAQTRSATASAAETEHAAGPGRSYVRPGTNLDIRV